MYDTVPVDDKTSAQLEHRVLQAAAVADELGSPMASDDIIAAVSALTWLGVQPSQALLELFFEAVGPDPLGLAAEGLCSLLWILAAEGLGVAAGEKLESGEYQQQMTSASLVTAAAVF
eukprot:gene3613-3877_t